jgi:transcriptional regulator with GAF, ATPase, and Fis domain
VTEERTRGTLAGRIVRLTFAVGALTITAALIVAIASTSQLTAETSRNRDLRALSLVEDEISTHADEVAASIESAIGRSRTQDELSRGLAAALASNSSSINQIILADRTGRTRSVIPSDTPVGRIRGNPAFLDALAGRTGFVSIAPAEGRAHELWLTRTVIAEGGEPLVVLVSVDTAFLQEFLVATGRELNGRSLVLLQDDARIAQYDGSGGLRLGSARWIAQDANSGAVRAMSGVGEMLQGHYERVAGVEGVDWRAAVLAPVSEQLADTVRTVAPSAGVLVIGGLTALAGAWLMSVRLARPLRELERAALNAASGSYVRRLSTDRDDEVGRVSQAFNAVALRLNALQDLSQLLASATSIDQVLDGIVSAIRHLVGPGSVALYLLDEDGILIPQRTEGRALSRVEPAVLIEHDWLMRVAEESGPLVYDPATDTGEPVPGLDAAGYALLGASLVAGHELLGMVAVTRQPDSPLSTAEQEMLRTFCAQASVALQTSRLFEIETRSRRIAEALKSVAEELVRPASLQGSLQRVEGIVADLFGSKVCLVAIADRDAVGLAASGAPEVEAAILDVGYRALKGGVPGEPVVIGTNDSEAGDALLEALGVTALMLVPIALDTERGGLLAVGLEAAPTTTTRNVGRALADEVALALDNAYFYQRAVARAANLETIFRISQAVGSSLQVNVVLNRVLDVVQKILSADAVALLSYDRDRRKIVTSMGRGAVPGPLLHLEIEPGEDIPGQVFERGEPVSLRDLDAATAGVAKSAALSGLRSLVAVPLLARGRSIGVLIVFAQEPGAFSDEDTNTLQTFASQAALAIDTARLYSREHEVATVLQASILPEELPEFPEVRAGSVYAPAGGEAEIGGDYYDVFRARDGSVWFAIADVCGKGVHAATKTSMIKYVVRALAAAGRQPAQLMSEVNNMISESGDPSEIVTLWVGRYHGQSRRLVWADGGHPPGLLRRADGSVETLGVTGALLGAVMHAPYEQLEVTLEVGDRLLLYTDGVTEARRGNIFYGEERVRDSLETVGTPAACASALLASVKEYVQGDLRDDVAILVIEPSEITRDAADAENGK